MAKDLQQLNYSGPVKAVILNQGDHVYSKVRFDKNTIQSFKKDGLMVQDSLTRSLIWRNMWQQVLDFKLSASDFFNFLSQNLPNEQTEDTVKDQIKNARGLISFFLPLDKVDSSREKFFDALLQIASKNTTSPNIKEKIIEDLDVFI
jgi:aminopeptidase N